MRSSSLALLATLALSLILSVSAIPPNTPADMDPEAEAECLLDSLHFTNGLAIIGAFQPDKFHYTCSCSNYNVGGGFWTVVQPHMMDSGSSAEISHNGNPINFRSTNNAISNGGPNGQAPNSPLFESSPIHFVVGENTIVVGVGCNGGGVPLPCYYQYTIKCNMPPPSDGGFVVGDPQFVGLRGQNYQVHGVSGEVYNIVSDADLQFNSRFVFLDSGKCPVVDGKKQDE